LLRQVPRTVIACLIVIAGMTVLRGTFAALMDLRVDEAYYWTWSKESVLSYLDHPPGIAWSVRLGTAIFGDTNFGVRLSGLLAMAAMQILLADITWRTTHDARAAAIAALLPDATLDYGLSMAKVAPDTTLIVFALALAWTLVRLAKSNDMRWWLLAGVFGGCCLLSKYTSVLLVPAIAAYVLVPDWRRRHLSSSCFWLAPVIALVIFLPVIWWNVQHDFVSLKFQSSRATHGLSTRFLWDHVGQQFILIGLLVMPVVAGGAAILGWRGIRTRAPIALLLATAVLFPLGFFLVVSSVMRIGDTWPLLAWPFGFAAAAINLHQWPRERPQSRLARSAPAVMGVALIGGIATVATVTLYYLASGRNIAGLDDPYGKEAGFADVVRDATRDLERSGATWFATTDYRIYSQLRWHLRDRIPVVQVNERNRFLDFQRDSRLRIDQPGLYIYANAKPALWSATSAAFTPLGHIDLIWRGVTYGGYTIEKITGFVPDLSPPPGSAFFVSTPL
jgi:4-amino-4-deoxy-L-arabinose transferase-like glycosyltransferase